MATDLYFTGDFQNAAFGHKGLRILGAKPDRDWET